MNSNVSVLFRRSFAYFIDIILILGIVFFIGYLLGFKEVLHRYLSDTNNFEYRVQFLFWRNNIRDISFFIYCLYCCVLEASALEGTLGKYLLKIKVMNHNGGKLTLTNSIKRNLFKILSYIPMGLGFIWALFSKERYTWHDYFAKTMVVNK